jgi:hypothetical protein
MRDTWCDWQIRNADWNLGRADMARDMRQLAERLLGRRMGAPRTLFDLADFADDCGRQMLGDELRRADDLVNVARDLPEPDKSAVLSDVASWLRTVAGEVESRD